MSSAAAFQDTQETSTSFVLDIPKPLPETAQELDLTSGSVTSDMLNARVIEVFNAQADLKGIAVVADGKPVGLINRNDFFAMFARPFARELYLKRKCGDFMDPDPLIVAGDAQISDVGNAVAARGEKALADGFLVIDRDGDYLGLCDGIVLLRALADLQGEQHRQLLSSIDYAGTIQTALLADSRAALEHGMPGRHALLWHPRDIVGGDCFFASRDSEGLLIGAIDCTGHGVPGALLTSIAISETNRLANDDCMRRSPAAMLAGLNGRVKEALQQQGGSDIANETADDGMDAIFVRIDEARAQILIASAKLPIFVFDAVGNLQTLKGTRKGLGYRDTPIDQVFEEHSFARADVSRIVMATDGLCDQIGEVKKIAFGWNRIRQILTETFAKPVDAQAAELWQGFLDYQGKQFRRDDVTVLCVDVTAPIVTQGEK